VRFKAFQEKGILSGLFLIFYGVFRIIAEFYREPDKQIGYIDGSFTMGQILCIPMILVGVAILLYSAKGTATAKAK
jgi:phosphatidylglycerol:prolipoprotein diacylglycerol transferase